MPIIPNGRGSTMASTVFDALSKADAVQYIVGVCADTTASMTGPHSGMFRLLEGHFGSPLLKLPCRHHAADLLPRSGFAAIFGKTTAPARSDFVSFRTKWTGIKDQATQLKQPSFDHPFLLNELDVVRESCTQVLQDPDVRSNWQEIAQQSLDVFGLPMPGEI